MIKDRLITFGVIFVTIILVYVVTRSFFLSFVEGYPLLSSFIKFFFLASIGDFISTRFKEKHWLIPRMIIPKAFIWGIIGIIIYMMFKIYPIGIELLQIKGVLPFLGNAFFKALFISILMNFTFAPTMMSFHRVTDTFLNEYSLGNKLSVSETIGKIDWSKFFTFTIFRTIPLFWVPAHTVTFLLPEEYQIIFAAVLGIALGLLLGLFSNKPQKELTS